MGMFDMVEEMPTEGAIRGLTGEAVQEADAAIEDGMIRKAPFTPESEKIVKAIKRYLSQQGWGCKVRVVKGIVHWQVVAKREMTPEHKAMLQAALQLARDNKAAATAATSTPASTPAPVATPAPEAAKAPEQAPKAEKASQASKAS